MSSIARHPKRLIEVDLPIREISAIARREKLSHHGSLATLHIWWARRPPAACRAVLAAASWYDPADVACPASFRSRAKELLLDFAENLRTKREVAELVGKHWGDWRDVTAASWHGDTPDTWLAVRAALLEVVLVYADPKGAQDARILQLVRDLTKAAFPKGDPVAWDPFAGGGAIPVEALRLGHEVLAADLNPIAVMLNRIVVEYIPKYGEVLREAFHAAARRIAARAKGQLARYYPSRSGAAPIVYLWARQVRCEGPRCGAEIPLIRNLQITRVGAQWYLELRVTGIQIAVDVRKGGRTQQRPTVAGGAATCPVCNFTTRAAAVRDQLRHYGGGANTARLLAVYVDAQDGRQFLEPGEADASAFQLATSSLDRSGVPVEA